ncbi:VCBS repeat-containing protein, partial [bacterium AH-315-F18]|nr:VCBS repeat-containing protein [bacterium AH-315-F18]
SRLSYPDGSHLIDQNGDGQYGTSEDVWRLDRDGDGVYDFEGVVLRDEDLEADPPSSSALRIQPSVGRIQMKPEKQRYRVGSWDAELLVPVRLLLTPARWGSPNGLILRLSTSQGSFVGGNELTVAPDAPGVTVHGNGSVSIERLLKVPGNVRGLFYLSVRAWSAGKNVVGSTIVEVRRPQRPADDEALPSPTDDTPSPTEDQPKPDEPTSPQAPSLPVITRVFPAAGPLSGGTELVITGTGFSVRDAGSVVVTIGEKAATSITVVSDTQLTALTPPGDLAQMTDVRVVNNNGEFTQISGFTYHPKPTINRVLSVSGEWTVGTEVNIFGSGFTAHGVVDNTVTVAGARSIHVDARSDTWITARLSAGAAGAGLVEVSNSNGLARYVVNFSPASNLVETAGVGSDYTMSIAMGDVDGDGDLDMVEGNYLSANRVRLNDGKGGFTGTGQALGAYPNTSTVVLGDLDGDGDLDLVTGNYRDVPNEVLFNDGHGVFTDSGQALGMYWTLCLALGDVDGDGDLDLITGNGGNDTNYLYLNDGNGVFTESGHRFHFSWTKSLNLVDLDGDGDLDLVVGNDIYANRVYFNDGHGVFTDSWQSIGRGATYWIALGDVDGDGDLDMVTANWYQSDNQVFFNDGKGYFTDSGQTLPKDLTLSAALGDLDGDGDLDLVLGNSI